jgi:ABC-type multidrug transport system ATPase subunit
MEEAERLCDRVGLLLDGILRAIGRPPELEAALGPEASLEDVFRADAADTAGQDKGGLRDVATRVNPLSYEVNALRQLLLGLPGNLAADFAVLVGAAVVGIAAASRLLGRLAR